MATPVKSFPRLSACGWEPRKYTEGASQSFVRGDLLELSSGKAVIMEAAGGNVQASDGEVLGWALDDATGVTDSDCWVMAPVSREHFMDLHSDTTTAVANLSVECEITHSATEGYLADVGTTGSPVIEIIEIPSDYPLGESKGLLRCRFLDSVYLGG